jgi:hypothetical protein
MMALYKWPHVTPLFGLFGTWQQPELCRRVDANTATNEETIVLSMLTAGQVPNSMHDSADLKQSSSPLS